MRESTTWFSQRLQREMPLVRWGHWGQALLLFPTAGGDCEEVERHHLLSAIEPWIAGGKIKVYSVDSWAGRTWLTQKAHNPAHCVWIQEQFLHYLAEEVVPAIRQDCRDAQMRVWVAGASIGAYNSVLCGCRRPDLFSRVLGMSGTYDLEPWLGGRWIDEFWGLSPLLFVPQLAEDSPQLQQLRSVQFYLATGQGRYENPQESWRVAGALGPRGIPNRVDLWDAQWDHDWPTWRAMLPAYLRDWLG